MLIPRRSCPIPTEAGHYIEEIDAGRYTLEDLHCMTPAFLSVHPFRIGALPEAWNSFDRYDETTKSIHYTNLETQPWRRAGYPYGQLWFDHLEEARAAGVVTDENIRLSILRGVVRRDLTEGNAPSPVRRLLRRLRGPA